MPTTEIFRSKSPLLRWRTGNEPVPGNLSQHQSYLGQEKVNIVPDLNQHRLLRIHAKQSLAIDSDRVPA